MANVFFCYSHKDEQTRDDLEAHCATLKNQGLISTWHDRRIIAGDEWDGKIGENLEQADIILLLVTHNFLDSRYINDVELKRALEKHAAGEARVIPVIVDHCDWQASVIGKLQAVPPDGKPIAKFPNRNEALVEVVKAIREVIKARVGVANPAPTKAAAATPPAARIVPEARSSNLRVKKTITDHDRDTFRETAFEYIAKYFDSSLAELEKRNDGITTKFRQKDANHFTARIYRGGTCVSECGIRLNGGMMGKHISYSQQPDSTNSFNESMDVADDGYSLFMRPSMGMWRSGSDGTKSQLSAQGAAEYFWSMLIEPLQR
ncbi:MAG: toll/interleukin-1 receptor domain-containing protein [Gemmataceae bacterium]